MSENFEKAQEQTEAMFNGEAAVEASGESAAEPVAQENTPQEVPAAEEPALSDEQKNFAQAAETANAAAQLAAHKDAELSSALEQIRRLKEEKAQLENTVAEMSAANEAQVTEQLIAPPALNINDLTFADEETVRAAEKQYADDMTAYARQQIMNELSPYLEEAKAGMAEKQRRQTLEKLSAIPELEGISDPALQSRMDNIIKNNNVFGSGEASPEEKYITAYLIARGVQAANTPAPTEPTTEQLMKYYNDSREFREAVEKQRIGELSKNNQQVPVLSASSGAGGAALNIKEKPKTFDAASSLARSLFGH